MVSGLFIPFSSINFSNICFALLVELLSILTEVPLEDLKSSVYIEPAQVSA